MKKGYLGLLTMYLRHWVAQSIMVQTCHFSNYFAKHGKDFDIEVAINNYLGIQEMLVYLSHFISNILNNRIFLVFDCQRLLE